MKLLIDTNVILDALMTREPWAASARALLLAAAEEKFEACITASSFTDLYYLLRKHLPNKEKTRQALLGLLASVNVLDVTGADCEKAFDLPMSDYEDALLAQCGKRHKADSIISRDLHHFHGSPLQAVGPDEILDKLE